MTVSLYPATSPYYTTDVVNDKYLDIMVNRSVPQLSSDVYWQITPEYDLRPDLLAYDLYTDSRLWWVFGARNPDLLPDPFFNFTTGQGIYLPKMDALQKALGI